jgi:hypothetical protein
VGKQVVADGDRLRALEVRVPRHHPVGVPIRLSAKRLNEHGDLGGQLAGGGAAVEAEIQGDLVVARPACMQRSPRRRDLGQAPLDRGVNVFVGVEKLEGAGVELFADSPQAPLDCAQLRRRDDVRGRQPACVRDAARNVKGVQLEVGVQRRREALELNQQAPLEATTPQRLRLSGYFPRRLTSPSRLPRSRACRRPWTCADVRTPIPHSLMKPAAAD